MMRERETARPRFPRTTASRIVSSTTLTAFVVVLLCRIGTKRAWAHDSDAGYFDAYGALVPEAPVEYRPFLDGYRQRQCELIMGRTTNIAGPSLGVVDVVLLMRLPSGGFEVVSRSERWTAEPALRRPVITTMVADLDTPTAEIVSRACADVLARHDSHQGWGKDGRMFYASHWTPRGTLTGWRWSPDRGTVAYAFVALGWKLVQYAEAKPEQRDALHREIEITARDLSLRTSHKH